MDYGYGQGYGYGGNIMQGPGHLHEGSHVSINLLNKS